MPRGARPPPAAPPESPPGRAIGGGCGTIPAVTRRQFLALILPLIVVLVGYLGLVILERTGFGGAPPWDEGFGRDLRHSMAREFAYGLGDRQRQLDAYFRALNGWLSAFDEYGEVVPPWELDAVRERSSGQYFGIGVRTLRPEVPGTPAGVEVTGVKPGGPADKAGVKVGDRILGVDGKSLVELERQGNARALEEAIRGERGTPLTLRLLGTDGTERSVAVVRDAIDTGSVFGARLVDEEARLGYLRLSGFHLDTAASAARELRKLLKRDLKGLVLDLRENAGGLLEQAVGVANLFLAEGVIVRVVGRGPDYPKIHRAVADRALCTDLPLVVLINRHSASASEVLAGALQDHRRAAIVGERSYGKFLVQTVEELPMEYGTVLFKRTTAIYETPAGHHYQRRLAEGAKDPLAGIQPDLFVPMSLPEGQRLAEIFANEEYADWNPSQPAVHAEFVDPHIEAAVALLTGRPQAPRITAR